MAHEERKSMMEQRENGRKNKQGKKPSGSWSGFMNKSLLVGGALALTGLIMYNSSSPLLSINAIASVEEKATIIPEPKLQLPEKQQGKRAVAIFAGGCFWGVEGVFSYVDGVYSAQSGYHGGGSGNASYKMVSYGLTKHAEAVRVEYDPSVVSYGELMQIFFSVIADPTQYNRQGPDKGAHYRSALVPVNAAQEKMAKAYLNQLDAGGYWDKPIVTKVEAFTQFHPAEDYHQDFMVNNPRHPYIVRWDNPKLMNLYAHYGNKTRKSSAP